MSVPEHIYLVDHNPEMVDAWRGAFEGHPVTPILGGYFTQHADCLLSPANSFGLMDGGLDWAIREQLGEEIEKTAQKAISEHFLGELPVGSALIIETKDARWPNMVIAPTMRVPELSQTTRNAYLAFRAALLAIHRRNDNVEKFAHVGITPIRTLVSSGLCTGVGRMPYVRCATQMREAYLQMKGDGKVPSIPEIYRVDALLKK